jgi:hypothetical protein
MHSDDVASLEKYYYASLSDAALADAVALGPNAYRQVQTWDILQREYDTRGLPPPAEAAAAFAAALEFNELRELVTKGQPNHPSPLIWNALNAEYVRRVVDVFATMLPAGDTCHNCGGRGPLRLQRFVLALAVREGWTPTLASFALSTLTIPLMSAAGFQGPTGQTYHLRLELRLCARCGREVSRILNRVRSRAKTLGLRFVPKADLPLPHWWPAL